MALFHYQDLKIIDLTLIIPRYLKKNLSGGAQSSSPLKSDILMDFANSAGA